MKNYSEHKQINLCRWKKRAGIHLIAASNINLNGKRDPGRLNNVMLAVMKFKFALLPMIRFLKSIFCNYPRHNCTTHRVSLETKMCQLLPIFTFAREIFFAMRRLQ